MVKNESRILERMLDSALPHVDAAVILDTGSTDGTQTLALDVLQKWGKPFVIREEPFVDYAFSRNRLLHYAQTAFPSQDWLLLLDADHILHVDVPNPWANLTADSYLVELRGALTYKMPYFVRASLAWRYLSPTHEYLTVDGGFAQADLEGVWLDHLEDGGNRHDKFQRDEELLEREYAVDPNNERTVFYLAQTIEHKDPERARTLYQRRFDLGGWEEERYIALLRIARITDTIEDWFKAWSFLPRRWEAAAGLIKVLHNGGRYHAAFMVGNEQRRLPREVPDILFVETDAAEWRFDLEFGLAAYYAGQPGIAKEHWLRVKESSAPDDVKQLTETNLTYC